MASKPAFVKGIKDIVVTGGRTAEQIKGRIVKMYVEVLRSGREKTMAVIGDAGNTLRSVLVLESWSVADQATMKKLVFPSEGKIVSFTNSRLQGKGRTLVYFDSDVKMCLDAATKKTVCEEDATYPTELPLLPEVKDAAAVSGACMISMVVAANVAGQVTEPSIGPGVTKKVCNLKVATGSKGMSASFWEPMAMQMAQASVGEVFRLDWMTLVPEGNGMFKISSASHSTSRLQTGDAADTARSALATDVESISATYGRTRAEKLKELFTQGSLSTLDHVQRLNLKKVLNLCF
ncbi:unnamed protein product [Polarella glacialis]|uniref:Replication protein A 70 kDa DNA-binding subunit n=1 Tax=Polarella glacialis TaxID=89957 RepID=A0A813JVH8_POLGL|nr:unnamed protein product [Polarella glacialis]